MTDIAQRVQKRLPVLQARLNALLSAQTVTTLEALHAARAAEDAAKYPARRRKHRGRGAAAILLAGLLFLSGCACDFRKMELIHGHPSRGAQPQVTEPMPVEPPLAPSGGVCVLSPAGGTSNHESAAARHSPPAGIDL